jgi:hypothetical protein
VNKQGSIARFESDDDALAAGFTTLLTTREASAAVHLPREDRHAFVASTRRIEQSRAKAKAARKARRANRR